MLFYEQEDTFIQNYRKLGTRTASGFILKILLLEEIFKQGINIINNNLNITFKEESVEIYNDTDYAYLSPLKETYFDIENNISIQPDKKIQSIHQLIAKIKEIDTNFFIDTRNQHNNAYADNENQFLYLCKLFLMPEVLYAENRFEYYQKSAKHFIKNSHLPEFEKFLCCLKKEQSFSFSEITIGNHNYKILPDNIQKDTYNFFIFAQNLYEARQDMAKIYAEKLVAFYIKSLNESIKITLKDSQYYFLHYKYEDYSITATLYNKDNSQCQDISTLPFNFNFTEKELSNTMYDSKKFDIDNLVINTMTLINMITCQEINSLIKKIENILFNTLWDSNNSVNIYAQDIAEQIMISANKQSIYSILPSDNQTCINKIKRI